MAQLTLDIEVKEAVKKLHKVGKGLKKKQLQKPLAIAARILRDEVKRNVPVAREKHGRWNTPKLVGRIRATKGFGIKVAEYEPGNLKRSVRVLTFKKSRNVYVGFKLDKGFRFGGSTVVYRGRKVDGFYAVMKMELGEAPMRRGVAASKEAVGNRIVKEVGSMIEGLVRSVEIR